MSNKPISPLEKLKIATARRLFARIRLDSYIDQNYKEMDSDLVNIIRYYQGSSDLRDGGFNRNRTRAVAFYTSA